MRVCFRSVDWAEPGAAVNTYATRPRNVLVLSSVTPSLASMLGQQIDGRNDARFGRFRDVSFANAIATTVGQTWPIDDRMAFGTTVATSLDESQVAVTTAYLQMMR
ncbi:hypothetical protein D9M68_954900 [compost metagenome]